MVKTFPSINDIAKEIAHMLMGVTIDSGEKPVHIVLSGGNTPVLIFKYLAENYKDKLADKRFHFWWGDERCVSPWDDESNYKQAFELWLQPIGISHENIHRIRGENECQEETVRYAEEILNWVDKADGWPRFDLILLGLGDDGHTASIFPDQISTLLTSDKVCQLVVHPVSGQKRVTLTGKVLNNARKVVFICTGENKANIVREVIKNSNPLLPASYIKPTHGDLIWLLDDKAARLI